MNTFVVTLPIKLWATKINIDLPSKPIQWCIFVVVKNVPKSCINRLAFLISLNSSLTISTDTPPVIKSFISKVAKEGDKVTLKCRPNMTWPPEEINFFVNGKPVTDPNFKSRYKANCQKLRIDKVRFPDDHAVFTCIVHNKYGSDVKNATLTVLGECIMGL